LELEQNIQITLDVADRSVIEQVSTQVAQAILGIRGQLNEALRLAQNRMEQEHQAQRAAIQGGP
jgi:hypothetical protein